MCKVMEDMRAEAREEGLEKGRAEGLEKGRAEGRAEGRENTLFDLVADGLLAASAAAAKLSLTPEQFSERAAEAGYKLG